MEHLRLRPKTYHFCATTTIYREHRYKASIAGDKVFVGNPCRLARRNGCARLRRRQQWRSLVRRRDPPRVDRLRVSGAGEEEGEEAAGALPSLLFLASRRV